MEFWQFWLSIGIIFAMLGIIIAICIRKHKDKHRIQALQTNLDNLEKSFKYLQEDMELATNQNLKVMEDKCQIMRELLMVADKKCQFAEDMIKSVEVATNSLKERNLSLGTHIVTSTMDDERVLEYKKELDINLETINRRLGFISNRLENLENSDLLDKDSLSIETTNTNESYEREIASLKREVADIKQNLSEMITMEVSKQLSGLDSGFAEIAFEGIRLDEENTRMLLEDKTDNAEVEASENPENLVELFPDTAEEMPKPKKITPINREYYPKGKELVVKEIMELYEQGYSTPKIASELNMSRGEIDLIIKMNQGMQVGGGRA